jgi:hypothetical protein
VLAVANGGALLGTLGTGWLTRRLGFGPAITISMAGMAVSLLLRLATHTTVLPMPPTGMALAWFCVSVYNINQIGLRQGMTPERMLGRMKATVRFVI